MARNLKIVRISCCFSVYKLGIIRKHWYDELELIEETLA